MIEVAGSIRAGSRTAPAGKAKVEVCNACYLPSVPGSRSQSGARFLFGFAVNPRGVARVGVRPDPQRSIGVTPEVPAASAGERTSGRVPPVQGGGRLQIAHLRPPVSIRNGAAWVAAG